MKENKNGNLIKEINKIIDRLETLGIPYYISDEINMVCDEFMDHSFQLNMSNGDIHEIHLIEGDDYEGVCISSESSYYGDYYSVSYDLRLEEDSKEFWSNINGMKRSYDMTEDILDGDTIVVNNTKIPKPITDISKISQEILYIPEANKYMCRAVFTNDIRKLGYWLLYTNKKDAKEASKRLFGVSNERK